MAQLWSPAETLRLTALHRRGDNFREIGERLGRSRSEVAGKCGRLGLTRKEPSVPEAKPSAVPTPPPPPPAPIVVAVPKPCTIVDLRFSSCRWIVKGEGASALYCNGEAPAGSSWCAGHRARAFTARDGRR